MKYWILAMSLFILGCGAGESGGAATSDAAVEDSAKSMGDDAADALNDMQDDAAAVEDALKAHKDNIDEELKKAEDAADD